MERTEFVKVCVEEGLTEHEAEIIYEGVPPPDSDTKPPTDMLEEEVREECQKSMKGIIEIRKMEGLLSQLLESISYGEHHCQECNKKGFCAIEPLAVYFGEHPGEEKHLQEIGGRLLNSDWPNVVIATALLARPTDPTPVAMQLALSTGYLIGKGVEIPEVKLSPKIVSEATKASRAPESGLEGLLEMLRQQRHPRSGS